MPDLMTHFLASHLVRRGRDAAAANPWSGAIALVFYIGAVLPDIITRPLTILTGSQTVFWATMPTHTPVILVVESWALSLLCRMELRARVFGLLCAGWLTHLALDLLQRHIWNGAYFWFFPFSWATGQIPLFWPNDAMWAIPFLLIIVVVIECWRNWHPDSRCHTQRHK